MDEILIACGDVQLLKKIAADLPSGRFKPIATKSSSGIVEKLATRRVKLAIVHESLTDAPGAALCVQLMRASAPPAILYLSTDMPPKEGPFTLALRYPVPGPVLRNALTRLMPDTGADHDMERWRAFFDELRARVQALGAQNYFEVLGVPTGAPHHHVVAAYDQLSLRYHPDRYAQFRDKDWGNAVYEQANLLFQTVTEAFSVLSDRRMRKLYERGLSSGQLRVDPAARATQDSGPETLDTQAQSKQGRKFLQLAQQDIARGDWASALQNLRFAQSMEGDLPVILQKIAEVEARLGKK